MLFSFTQQTRAQYITDSNFDEIKKKADKGDAVSQYNIGIYYLRIIKPVTKESLKLARQYIQKAAMQGNAEAEDQYGAFFEWEKDYKNALFWTQKAAEHGNIDAIYTMGRYYMEGIGVSIDLHKSFEYFESAAKQGYDIAMLWLGNFYYLGIQDTIDRDYYEAYKWYKKAAELGNTDAMIHLTDCYINGEGCGKNFKIAEMWLSKAQAVSGKDFNEDFVRWQKLADKGNQNYATFLKFHKNQQ